MIITKLGLERFFGSDLTCMAAVARISSRTFGKGIDEAVETGDVGSTGMRL